MRHRRLLLGVLGATLVVAPATSARAARPDATATTNRAGVIVDEGNGTVKKVGITFSGTISGIAALQLAGFSPILRNFGGIGGAVCAIDVGGTHYGCPADNTCLTCAAPDYWAYSRAAKGSDKMATSPVGAGATKVHDGDVEGWVWGTGGTPTYVPIDKFFPATPTTTVPAPPTSAPHTTSPSTTPRRSPPPPVHAQGTQPGDATTTAPKSTTTAHGSTTTRATVTTTTRHHGATTTTRHTDSSTDARAGPSGNNGARRLAAAPPTVHDSSGSSPVTWIVFAAIVAALLIAIFAAHRRRARAATH